MASLYTTQKLQCGIAKWLARYLLSCLVILLSTNQMLFFFCSFLGHRVTDSFDCNKQQNFTWCRLLKFIPLWALSVSTAKERSEPNYTKLTVMMTESCWFHICLQLCQQKHKQASAQGLRRDLRYSRVPNAQITITFLPSFCIWGSFWFGAICYSVVITPIGK